jgi:hypothetical protein
MGILDKVKFWKKDDDFEMDDFDKMATDSASSGVPKDDLGLGPSVLDKPAPATTQQDPLAPAALSPEPPKTTNSDSPDIMNRELELISSKLDTIKFLLQSLDQRVAHIEKIAGVEEEEQKKRQKQQHNLW